MKASKIYDLLPSLPLFQGLSKADMATIVDETTFTVRKFAAHKVVRQEGEACQSLWFLLSGKVRSVAHADDHGYTFEEELTTPDVLQAERLFGLVQRYSKTFITDSPSEFLILDKQEVVRLLDKFVIFRLNMLNIVSTQSQKASRHPWHVVNTVRQRIIRFFEIHFSRPAGAKIVRIKMTRLASELNMGKQPVSQELNKLQAEGLLTFSRATIRIPAFEKLRPT